MNTLEDVLADLFERAFDSACGGLAIEVSRTSGTRLWWFKDPDSRASPNGTHAPRGVNWGYSLRDLRRVVPMVPNRACVVSEPGKDTFWTVTSNSVGEFPTFEAALAYANLAL